jgi:plasmid stabilization system protein ParE
MTPTFIVQPEAETDISEAFRWYEDKDEGLGSEFLRMVEASFAVIERYPQFYPVVRKQVRRAVLRRFPYSMFYFADDTKIVVIACIQASRNPKIWRRRVDDFSKG